MFASKASITAAVLSRLRLLFEAMSLMLPTQGVSSAESTVKRPTSLGGRLEQIELTWTGEFRATGLETNFQSGLNPFEVELW